MSIGEHDTCPYCGHSNLIIGKNDAVVKELVEAARNILSLACPGMNWTDGIGRAATEDLKKAIKKVEGL